MTAVHSQTEQQHKLKLCLFLFSAFIFLLGRVQISHFPPSCYSTLNSAFGYESCCNNLSDTDRAVQTNTYRLLLPYQLPCSFLS